MTNPTNLNALKQYMNFYNANIADPNLRSSSDPYNSVRFNTNGMAADWAQQQLGGGGNPNGGGGTSNRMPDYFAGQSGGYQPTAYVPPRYSPAPSGGGPGEEQGTPVQTLARQAGFPLAPGQQQQPNPFAAQQAAQQATTQSGVANYLAQILQRTPRF